MKKLLQISIGLMIAGILFGIAETLYFGSNWFPQSTNELICDFIASYITGAGSSLWVLCVVIKIKNTKL